MSAGGRISLVARAALAALALLPPFGVAQEIRFHDVVVGGDYVNFPAVAGSDAAFHLAWTGKGQCANEELQRRQMGLDGAPLTPQQTGCDFGYEWPSIAALPSGTHVVVIPQAWARIFDALGSPMSPWILVPQDPPNRVGGAHVAAIPPDRFAVTWSYQVSNPPPVAELNARILMQDGTLPADQVTIQTDSPNNGYWAPVATLGSGHVVVAWNSGTGSTYVAFQILDGWLSPLAPIETVTSGSSYLTNLGARGSRFGIVWEDELAFKAWLRLYDENLGALTPDILVATYSSSSPLGPFPIRLDQAGRSVVAWFTGNSPLDVHAQRYDASGNPEGPQVILNMNTYSNQDFPQMAMRPSGDFVVVYNSAASGRTGMDGLMRRFFFPVSLAIGAGPGAGNAPRLRNVRPDGRPGLATLDPYGATGYGLNVGAGDVDGGGKDEMLTGPGPSPVYAPQVRAFKSDGTPIAKVNFYAYGTLRYGVRVHGGNIDLDSYDEILTAPGPGQSFGPHIRAFDYDDSSLQPAAKVSFFAYSTLKYGARVAAGDIDGDGIREILTAPGPGIAFSPNIRGFNYDGVVVTAISKVNFNAFAGPRYGATVGAADVESDGVGGFGDTYQEIVAGVGPDPYFTGLVRLFDYDNAAIAQKIEITAYPSILGANVAGGDVDAGDAEEIATAPGPDPSTDARTICWEWNPVIGVNPNGPELLPIPWDDFTTSFGQGYGGNVAIGTFE